MGSYSNRLTSKQGWDKRYWSTVWQKKKKTKGSTTMWKIRSWL